MICLARKKLSLFHLQIRLRLSLGDFKILFFWFPSAIQDNSPPGFTSAISSVCSVKFEKAIIKLCKKISELLLYNNFLIQYQKDAEDLPGD